MADKPTHKASHHSHAEAVKLLFTFQGTEKSLNVIPPVSVGELVAALETLFAGYNVTGVLIDGEMWVLSSKVITEVLLANPTRVHVLAGSPKSSVASSGVSTEGAFDSFEVKKRLGIFWDLKVDKFGVQSDPRQLYLDEIVSDRYAFINGLQVIHDELQLALMSDHDTVACAANMSLPSVLTTLAYTNCGDRVQAENTPIYMEIMGLRFACLSEDGRPKVEVFTPAGGGTDDGGVLCHVTYAHSLDGTIKKRLYQGNSKSFILVNIDLMTHVGRYDSPTKVIFGRVKESSWREDRDACGAIIGTLTGYKDDNTVHHRIKRNLGEENFNFLSQTGITLPDGTNITYLVAAAIVALQGMIDTCRGAAHSFDERSVAHLSATVTLNITSLQDMLIYVGRATVFQKEIKIHGFGLDARKYSGRIQSGTGIIVLTYDGLEGHQLKPYTLQSEHSEH